jgi:hypothetical protein
MDVDSALLGLALGPPLSQGQSDAVSTTSTQPVKTTIAPASPSSGHDNAASQSTSDHAAPPPPPPLLHIAPLPNGTVLDAGPAAETLKPPLAPKPKLKAKMGTVLKDTGHQTARLVIYNVLSGRLYEFNHHRVQELLWLRLDAKQSRGIEIGI